MFPVQTKITRKGSGDVTPTFCPAAGLLHSARRLARSSAHPDRGSVSPPFAAIGQGEKPVIPEAGAMYSFVNILDVGSAHLGDLLLASQEIGEAISTLEESGATLVALTDRSDWQSEGFRALNALLERLRDDTGVEIGHLSVRRWELGGAV